MRKLVATAVAISLFLVPLGASAPAFAADDADASPWQTGANSRARLLVAGPLQKGSYLAGLEIDLKAGAHTYWRDPGDAGVPPVLSTEGSRNVKSASLHFPAPERIQEGALSVNGYRNSLILPLDVTPQDATAPVHLVIHFTYAACEKICIPAELAATLDLAPKAQASAQAPRIVAAQNSLPQMVSADSLGLKATPDQTPNKSLWRLALSAPARDLFAEGPKGWFFETKKGETGFELMAVERPQNWSGPVPVRLTVTGPKDVEVTLDLPSP